MNGTPAPVSADGPRTTRSTGGMVASVATFAVAVGGALLVLSHPALVAAFVSGVAGTVAVGLLGAVHDA